MFHHQFFFFFFFSLTSSRTIRFVSYARFCDSRSRRKIEPARSSVGFRRARFSGFGFSFLFVDDARLPRRRCEYSLHSSFLPDKTYHVRVVSKPFVYVVKPKLSQDIADFLHRELFHVSVSNRSLSRHLRPETRDISDFRFAIPRKLSRRIERAFPRLVSEAFSTPDVRLSVTLGRR